MALNLDQPIGGGQSEPITPESLYLVVGKVCRSGYLQQRLDQGGVFDRGLVVRSNNDLYRRGHQENGPPERAHVISFN